MGSNSVAAGKTGGEGQLVQGLNLFDATTIIIGSMIGSGIFIVSAAMARDVRSPGLLLAAWGLTAAMTILGALSYGELAAAMPNAGGQYVFLREAFGPLFGFLYGWTMFLVIQTGTIAAVSVAFAKFLGPLLPQVSASAILVPLPFGFSLTTQRAAAIGVIALLTWVNCRGLREGATVQNVFTVAKVGGLLVLVAAGFLAPSNPEAVRQNFGTPFPNPWNLTVLAVFGGALVGSLFSSDAWNNITFAGSEVVNPKRNLPLSLFLGTAVVSVIYIATNVMYLRTFPLEVIAKAPDDRVGTLAAQTVMGSTGLTFITLAILVSTFGCTNGLILAGARVYYAMARDGLFFRRVADISPRTHTPVFSLIIQGGWASILALSGTYSDLLDYVIFANLLFYVLTVSALFILRKKRPDLPRPYKAFGYPVLPALYVLMAALVMLDLLYVKPAYTWPGLVIVLTGVPVYWVWHSHQADRQRFKARLFTIWCWIGCGLSTALWGSLSVLSSVFSSGGRLQHFCMQQWAKQNLWLSRARVEIEGLESVDQTRPQIFVSNHSGLHDTLSLAACLPIQFRWIAKKSLFSVPFMGWHMRRSGYISIDRENPREAAKSIVEAARTIHSGVSAVAFPEGTRSRSGDLGRFHSGPFGLALRAGVPLVPITVEGSCRVIVPKTLQVNPGAILRIKIDKPIDLSGQAQGQKHRLMDEVYSIMSRNLQELRARRRSGEEREDAVFRWIYGESGAPDYESLRELAEEAAAAAKRGSK